MHVAIAIPSYKRPDSKIFERLSHIPWDKYIFVRREEKELYRHNKSHGFKIIALKNVNNIGETRRQIVKYFNSKEISWVLMLDDDTSKIEELCFDEERNSWRSKRLVYNPENIPTFELKALKRWAKAAEKNDLSLSAPLYRPFAWSSGGTEVRINSGQCIQVVLIKIPDVYFVGNYKSTDEVGAEDMAIQYELMANGFNTGIIPFVEYDCPSIGQGEGGNNASETLDLKKRYERYCKLFWENVSSNESLVKIHKTAKTGIPSIKFVWKNWKKEE